MKILNDDTCFVCGPDNPSGLKARFNVDQTCRSATCVIGIPAVYQGWQGMVHGGIIAALVDEAGIYACRAIGEHFVTAELNVKYKAPVPVATELLISAEVVEAKRKIILVKGKIEHQGETLVESTAKVFALVD